MKRLGTLLNRLTLVATLALLLAVALAGYSLLRTQVEADIYRERLVALQDDYQSLRERYNQAVRKTAVTELLVQGDSVCVLVRTAEGVLEKIPTPFSPADEIYVDYVVLKGRLWIRRVFDDRTAPRGGVVVNPKLVDVDWDAEGAAHGKAAYRRLSEGRWAVTVTGDGSLGLARVGDAEDVELSPPPTIGEFEPIEQTTAADVGRIGPSDVLKRLASP